MTWSQLAQYSTEILPLLLIARMMVLRIRLKRVYVVFCAFVGFQAFISVIIQFLRQIEPALTAVNFDYRLFWICQATILWILSVWLVYALVEAILASFPGILRFSRIFLNVVLSMAVAIGLLTIKPEMSVVGAGTYADPVTRWYATWIVLDRVISMTAALILILVLAFILWFPVRMPRNLAVLSVGFVIYFGVKTTFRLFLSYFSSHLDEPSLRPYNLTISTVLVVCFVYWILFITPQGQYREVKLGHSWRIGEQDRLLGQLEALNASLLRTPQR